MNFAAFIITYKRKNELIQLLNNITEQTVIPEHILIIDNDPDQSANEVASLFTNLSLEYHPVGYNSGPAGAANYGLTYLSQKGYDYIAWLDDDDPPSYTNTFEQLLELIQNHKQCGCVGVAGQYFNNEFGIVKRVRDEALKGEGSLSVSYIAGNMIKIVNADVVRKSKILPKTALFFGFEELQFDLQLKKAGYSLLVDKQIFYRHRKLYKRLNLHQPLLTKKCNKQLIRDYYSTRNLLYIMGENRFYIALIFVLLRSMLKSFFGFIYGLSYGAINFKYQFKAIVHFFTGRLGEVY